VLFFLDEKNLLSAISSNYSTDIDLNFFGGGLVVLSTDMFGWILAVAVVTVTVARLAFTSGLASLVVGLLVDTG